MTTRPSDVSILLMKPGELGEYIVPVGKWRGRPLKEIRSTELLDYCNYVQKVADRECKELNGPMLELMIIAHAYLGIKFYPQGDLPCGKKMAKD